MISIPPKYSVADAIGILKGKSATKIFDKHIDLKKQYEGTAL